MLSNYDIEACFTNNTMSSRQNITFTNQGSTTGNPFAQKGLFDNVAITLDKIFETLEKFENPWNFGKFCLLAGLAAGILFIRMHGVAASAATSPDLTRRKTQCGQQPTAREQTEDTPWPRSGTLCSSLAL